MEGGIGHVRSASPQSAKILVFVAALRDQGAGLSGCATMNKPILLVTTLAALAATAALAQAPQQQRQRSASTNDGLDPNEIVCRSESEVGSRLRRHRTCVTRAQWAEQMSQSRQYVEKAQTRRIWCKEGVVC